MYLMPSTHNSRFVDRDMLMRYMGGGVGHLCGDAPPTTRVQSDPGEIEEFLREVDDELNTSSDSDNDSIASSGSRDSDEEYYASL
jgi:hypothetical protein